ncbi:MULTISPECIES: hypothetical protein [Streptomyces]|uniref:hypothetical protein n=1 Tax=Streptomyces TaxID=1883 RepID=UPI0029A8E9FC|nr:hypothetical protein [Streptomyces sp. WI03-4A]MDX2592301.1 hypothetical protein [Streptomyces sp. WI03-4A]
MNQRKDTYRAALRRRPETTAPAASTSPAASTAAASTPSAPTRVTPLDTRYVKVTIELDAAPARDLGRWAGEQLSALVRAGEAVLRPLRQGGRAAREDHTA